MRVVCNLGEVKIRSRQIRMTLLPRAAQSVSERTQIQVIECTQIKEGSVLFLFACSTFLRLTTQVCRKSVLGDVTRSTDSDITTQPGCWL